MAYLAIVAIGAAVPVVLERQGRSLVVAIGWLVVLAVGLLPPMVLTTELVRRTGAASRVARTAIGAGSWAGWSMFVAFTAAELSRLVLLPGPVLRITAVVGVAGAGFALFAFDGRVARSSRIVIVLAAVVVASVILGSFFMAGHWGSAV
jgi:hypothetical protein